MTSEQKTGTSWWIKLCGGVVVFFLLAFGTLYFLGSAGTARWHRYADSLREDGLPLTFDEIARQQRDVPEGPTIADRLTEHADELGQLRAANADPYVWLFGRRGAEFNAFAGVQQYSIEPTRTFMADHQVLIDMLLASGELPPGRFPPPTDVDVMMFSMTELGATRGAGKLLRMLAVMELIDGDSGGAVHAVRLQCRILETLDEHPTTIGRLVQTAGEANMVATVEDTLRWTAPDAAALDALAEDIDNRLDAATMKWAMLGERAFLVAVCDQLAAGEMPTDLFTQGSDQMVPNWMPVWLVRQSQMRSAEMFTWLIDAADDPAALMNAAKRIDAEMPSAPATHFLLRTLMPSLTRACIVHTSVVAKLRSAHAAMAAERFRLANDRLPSSLEELVPDYLDAIPADPFDGMPLHFATTDEGIVIYSFGQNVYDGGEVARSKDHRSPPDIGFRLVEGEHRGIQLLDDPRPAEED